MSAYGRHTFSVESTSVSTAATTLYTWSDDAADNNHIALSGFLQCQVDNDSGSIALATFVLQLKDHPDGEFYTYIDGADWAEDTTQVLDMTTTPATLAASSIAHFTVAIYSAYDLRFTATSASSTVSTDIRGTFTGRIA